MTVTAPDTRARLLDIAAGRFLADGYAETTLRGIAAEAGVKAGSIYYHFASKDEMLAAVLDEGIERMAAALDSVLAAAPPDPAARLRAAIHGHLEALFEHGAYTACHVRVFHQAPPAVKHQATVRRDAYEAEWQRLLEEAAGAGALRDGLDLQLTRLYLLGALNATVEWFKGGDLGAVAATFADLFIAGAGSEGARS